MSGIRLRGIEKPFRDLPVLRGVDPGTDRR